ncbi:hypothetical protein TWF730_003650 [Orbilia blumenaviensis]|uniref:Mid2 domain-containing protein n=1 Tax=Orbilia blumenaviensis TaxID=1796055 RepID=A0AAV9U527_9PEZI
MPRVTAEQYTSGSLYYYPVISLSSGSSIALPCCPTASTSGVLQPRVMLTTTLSGSGSGSSGSTSTVILCNYLQSDNLEIFTTSFTSFSIFYRYLANPIYIFDDDATRTDQPVTSSAAGSSPTSQAATPGSGATSSTGPSSTAAPGGDGDEKKSGMATGTIIGIAVGVGVPVILIAMYLTYRFTRKGSAPIGSATPWTSSNKTEVGGTEPGIMDNPAEFGGIRGTANANDKSYH